MSGRADPQATGKRPPGRMMKPHPPPTAGEATGGGSGRLVLPDDFTALADNAGLSLAMPGDKQPAEAEWIDEAFAHYSIGKRMLKRIAPEAQQRDWCKIIAQQANDLRLSLGHLDDARLGGDRIRFRDGMQTLGQHWPGQRTGGNERYQLDRLACRLEPERLQAKRLRGEDGVSEVWWHFMGQRMPAALQMLELLAQHAADRYGQHVKHGGSKKKSPRAHLFRDLAGSHERLFGTLPRVTSIDAPDEEERANVPGGPSLEWFKGLFATVRCRARTLGRYPGATGTVPDADLDPQYAVVVELTEELLNAPHADALTKAIRAGAKARLAEPKPAPEPDDPALSQAVWEAMFPSSRK